MSGDGFGTVRKKKGEVIISYLGSHRKALAGLGYGVYEHGLLTISYALSLPEGSGGLTVWNVDFVLAMTQPRWKLQ